MDIRSRQPFLFPRFPTISSTSLASFPHIPRVSVSRIFFLFPASAESTASIFRCRHLHKSTTHSNLLASANSSILQQRKSFHHKCHHYGHLSIPTGFSNLRQTR